MFAGQMFGPGMLKASGSTKFQLRTKELASYTQLCVCKLCKGKELQVRVDTSWTIQSIGDGTVRVFRQRFALEDAIGSQICSLEAFFDRDLHSRMPSVPTSARLKRACV
jgi:hypothetical protein